MVVLKSLCQLETYKVQTWKKYLSDEICKADLFPFLINRTLVKVNMWEKRNYYILKKTLLLI